MGRSAMTAAEAGVLNVENTQRSSLSHHRDTNVAARVCVFGVAANWVRTVRSGKVVFAFAQRPAAFRWKGTFPAGGSSPSEGNVQQIARGIQYQGCPGGKELRQHA